MIFLEQEEASFSQLESNTRRMSNLALDDTNALFKVEKQASLSKEY